MTIDSSGTWSTSCTGVVRAPGRGPVRVSGHDGSTLDRIHGRNPGGKRNLLPGAFPEPGKESAAPALSIRCGPGARFFLLSGGLCSHSTGDTPRAPANGAE